MDLSISKEHQQFREEVREFHESSLTDDLRAAARLSTSVFPDAERSLAWQRILHRRGWAAPKWPRQYGGTGWDPMQLLIYHEEATKAQAPAAIMMGLGMCGPCIIGCGNEEQKAHYLPRILSTEDVWCQGYSEPNSGSDLASIMCSAVSDGDDYIINGSKIWTSMAQHCNHIFCLVRTSSEGRPQQGITFLLIDMRTPGISVEPILNLNGYPEQNSVFFENVRVPKENRIGEEDRGWSVAKYLLQFERGGVVIPQTLFDRILLIKQAAKLQVNSDGSLLSNDKTFRRKLAEVEIELNAMVFADLRMRCARSSAEEPRGGASFIKIGFTELTQRLTALHVEASGVYSLVHQPEALVPGNTADAIAAGPTTTAMPGHLDARATTIYGGSNEIQRNIIAKAALGL